MTIVTRIAAMGTWPVLSIFGFAGAQAFGSPGSQSNKYSFAVPEEVRQVVTHLLPQGKAEGEITGTVELYSGPPRMTLEQIGPLAFVAKGKTLYSFSFDKSLDPVKTANNPTNLTLLACFIAVSKDSPSNVKILGTRRSLPMQGVPESVLIIADGNWPMALTRKRKNDPTPTIDPRLSQRLVISSGARWTGVGTLDGIQWTHTRDLIRTNLLPLKLSKENDRLTLTLLAARKHDSVITFAADGTPVDANAIHLTVVIDNHSLKPRDRDPDTESGEP